MKAHDSLNTRSRRFPSGQPVLSLLAGTALTGLLAMSVSCGPPPHPRPPTAEPVFYPALPDTPRIQYLTLLRSSEDIDPQSEFEKYVVGERRNLTLSHAYGVAPYDGRLYVCDTKLGTVITFDLGKRKFGWIESAKRGQIQNPLSIAIAQDGMKYLVDSSQPRIVVLDAADRVVSFFGNDDLFKPVDVAVFGDRLYVADLKDHEIQILDRKTGESIGTIGELGPEPGQFSAPTGIAVDREGDLYVTDLLNARVQKFDPEGNLLLNFGQSGRFPGDFARPKGIAVDREGIIYVVDAAFENVQLFNQEGQALMFFGGYGDEPGSMWLPAKVALDYDPDDIAYFKDYVHEDREIEYLIFVSNQMGPSHIGVYGYLRQEK